MTTTRARIEKAPSLAKDDRAGFRPDARSVPRVRWTVNARGSPSPRGRGAGLCTLEMRTDRVSDAPAIDGGTMASPRNTGSRPADRLQGGRGQPGGPPRPRGRGA